MRMLLVLFTIAAAIILFVQGASGNANSVLYIILSAVLMLQVLAWVFLRYLPSLKLRSEIREVLDDQPGFLFPYEVAEKIGTARARNARLGSAPTKEEIKKHSPNPAVVGAEMRQMRRDGELEQSLGSGFEPNKRYGYKLVDDSVFV